MNNWVTIPTSARQDHDTPAAQVYSAYNIFHYTDSNSFSIIGDLKTFPSYYCVRFLATLVLCFHKVHMHIKLYNHAVSKQKSVVLSLFLR